MNKEEINLVRVELVKLFKYYRRGFDSTIMNLYLEALDDIPIKYILSSLKTLIKTKTFMPSIAEIRELCPKDRVIKERKMVMDSPEDYNPNFEIPAKYTGQILEFLRKK